MSEPKDQAYKNWLEQGAEEFCFKPQYIYQYWIVSDDDYSHVSDGPFNSEHEAWLTLDNSPYRKVVKTKHRVLETSED